MAVLLSPAALRYTLPRQLKLAFAIALVLLLLFIVPGTCVDKTSRFLVARNVVKW